ncbi:uncharacterized protein LOC135811288 isoform X2 [Sycon ciliatum]|uniref:uncharacterized protein LOC135811288 isoform X2 n=1 Tax=Sycon ciliatum TaxID=27933 RepID=UPI0031F60AE6
MRYSLQRHGDPAVCLLLLTALLGLVRCGPNPGMRLLFDDSIVETPPDHRYNIKLYGAVGDGVHNDTDAVLAALKAASQAVNYSSVLIPAGRFLIWPLLIEDCMNTWIEVEGTVLAPREPHDWPQNEYYIKFANPNNCSLVGLEHGAGIEGNGMGWWALPDMEDSAPSLIVFSGEFDGYPQPGVFNISLFNAPYAHILVKGTRMYSGPEVSGVKIMATDQGDSAGIVVNNASMFIEMCDIEVGGVNVMIATGYGDMNHGFMRVSQSTLRRGGGVVMEMTDGIMGNVSLDSLSFYSTSHGIRALGAQDGSGELIGVFSDDLYMMDVGVPFLVSNDYCPKSHKGCTRPAKGVSVTMLNFDRVSGTQTTGNAGTFNCIESKPCTVSLSNVDIRPSGPGMDNTFHCRNAIGWTDETVSPTSCLKKEGNMLSFFSRQ